MPHKLTGDTVEGYEEMKYEITKRFLPGTLLAGITITEVTSVAFRLGYVCEKPCGGGSGYEIIRVRILP